MKNRMKLLFLATLGVLMLGGCNKETEIPPTVRLTQAPEETADISAIADILNDESIESDASAYLLKWNTNEFDLKAPADIDEFLKAAEDFGLDLQVSSNLNDMWKDAGDVETLMTEKNLSTGDLLRYPYIKMYENGSWIVKLSDDYNDVHMSLKRTQKARIYGELTLIPGEDMMLGNANYAFGTMSEEDMRKLKGMFDYIEVIPYEDRFITVNCYLGDEKTDAFAVRYSFEYETATNEVVNQEYKVVYNELVRSLDEENQELYRNYETEMEGTEASEVESSEIK